jgi:hypothetical protein
VTTILERMREELVRRNYAENTIRSYLRIVLDFEGYVSKPLEKVDADDLRRHHAYLLDKRKLAVRTVVQRVAAVRLLYCKALKRRDMKEDLPYPRKYRRRLPVILSVEEVAQVIDCARNLFHRALLMTAYTRDKIPFVEIDRVEVQFLIFDQQHDASRNKALADPADPVSGLQRGRSTGFETGQAVVLYFDNLSVLDHGKGKTGCSLPAELSIDVGIQVVTANA